MGGFPAFAESGKHGDSLRSFAAVLLCDAWKHWLRGGCTLRKWCCERLGSFHPERRFVIILEVFHCLSVICLASDLFSLGFVKSRRAWERCQLVGLVQDVDEVILATG